MGVDDNNLEWRRLDAAQSGSERRETAQDLASEASKHNPILFCRNIDLALVRSCCDQRVIYTGIRDPDTRL